MKAHAALSSKEVVASQRRRIDEQEAEEAETGRKKRGWKPKEPEGVKNKDRYTKPLFVELFPFGGKLDKENRWI